MGKEWDNFKPEYVSERITKTEERYPDDYPNPNLRGRKKNSMNSEPKISGSYDLSLNGNQKFQLWWEQVAKECLRVLKPGGFLLSFGGTRTYHRMICGIEDAGFEIRDTIMWLYGSGFPKSLNIGKQIDKMNNRPEDYPELRAYLKKKRAEKGLTIKQVAEKLGVYQALYGFYEQKNTCSQIPSKRLWNKLKEILELDNRFDELIARIGAEREVIGKNDYTNPKELYQVGKEKIGTREDSLITTPNLPEAKQWEGWGTALKPACEPIVVSRKPLSEKNVALNVLKHGTGGMNIDESRISLNGEKQPQGSAKRVFKSNQYTDEKIYGDNKKTSEQGRFPANIILDEEAGKLMPNDEEEYGYDIAQQQTLFGNILNKSEIKSASRFFYCAKASKNERNFGCEEIEPQKQDEGRKEGNIGGDNPRNRGVHLRKNNHPTVKPIALMEYLIKLVSREGAVVLDPFIGSGTTAIACVKTNRMFIGIEKESDYVKIAQARIKPYLEQTKL